MHNRLIVKDLQVRIEKGKENLYAVRGLDFTLKAGEVLCLVGESGCGKSLTALSILNLMKPPVYAKGEILFHNKNILSMSATELQALRGKRIALIFQEPMSALNPVYTIGYQIIENLRASGDQSKKYQAKAAELLRSVGIGDAARRLNNYPHELSGGMLQRVMIAMALAGEPEILIADEPTTALDVTIQAQILDLLRSIIKERGLSLLLITHDFGVVAELADRVAVMYAGKIVEQGTVHGIFHQAHHPYTRALFAAMPQDTALPENSKRPVLYTIQGSVPDLSNIPAGCAFHPRCPQKTSECEKEIPIIKKSNGQELACFHPYI